MIKREVSCTVLKLGDGPPCKVCKKKMDVVRIETPGSLFGKKGAYCHPCGSRGIQQ